MNLTAVTIHFLVQPIMATSYIVLLNCTQNIKCHIIAQLYWLLLRYGICNMLWHMSCYNHNIIGICYCKIYVQSCLWKKNNPNTNLVCENRNNPNTLNKKHAKNNSDKNSALRQKVISSGWTMPLHANARMYHLAGDDSRRIGSYAECYRLGIGKCHCQQMCRFQPTLA